MDSTRFSAAVPVLSVWPEMTMLSTYFAFSLLERNAPNTCTSCDNTGSLPAFICEEPRSKNTPSLRIMLPLSPMATLSHAHHAHDAVAYLLKYRQAQHGDGLHLIAHGGQLRVGGGHIVLLLCYEGLLCGNLVLLGGDLRLPLGKRQPGLVEIDSYKRKLVLGVLHLRLRQRKLALRVGQHLLRALQVVAGDKILYVGDEHQEKQNKREGGHHVRIRRPEALLTLVRGDEGVRAPGAVPPHCLPPFSMPRVSWRITPTKSRMATSMRSTVP